MVSVSSHTRLPSQFIRGTSRRASLTVMESSSTVRELMLESFRLVLGRAERPLETLSGNILRVRPLLENLRMESEKERELKTSATVRSTREISRKEREKDGESSLRRTAQSSKENSRPIRDLVSLRLLIRPVRNLSRASLRMDLAKRAPMKTGRRLTTRLILLRNNKRSS